MIDLDGHVRVVQRCVAGPVYCDADHQAMTVYLAVQLPTRVNVPALDRALADLQERYGCIRQLVVEVGGAYYYAQTDEPLHVEVADDVDDAAAGHGQAWAERLSEPAASSDAGLPGAMRGLRVLAGKRTVVVAMNHALMDGGALLTLTTELLEGYAGYRAGTGRAASPDVPPTLSETTFEALELPVGSDWIPVAGYAHDAFVPPADMGRLDELVELTAPTASVLSLCKRLGSSPAAFFTAMIAHAIRESHPRDPQRHLVASIAIDYRTLLGCENTIRNASWTAAFDLDDSACNGMGWQEQAKWLRSAIGTRRDVRYAKGWIKTERAINVMSSRLQKKRLHDTRETSAQQSFMLTYLRLPDSSAFDGAKVCFSGFSLPSDMTLVEHAGSFHLFFIPLQRQDAFLAALDEAAAEVGLAFASDSLRKPSIHSEVSALQAGGPCVFFACDPTSQDVEALAAEMRSYVERGYRVRAYTSSRLASLVEEAGAACISCDPIFSDSDASGATWADELEDMLRQDVRVFEPECMVASQSCAWAAPLADKLGLRLENHPRARLWSELWDTDSYDESLTLQDLAWATFDAPGTAIVCGGRRMSYADFHRTTTRIACALIERGLKATDVVAIHMRRDERLLCAMFGIIKAGAAYLVLNTDWPQQRLRYVVENSDARYVIANEVPQDSRVSAETISYQWLVEKPVPGEAGPQGVLRARMLRPHSSDVAALYYTSGSTGKPKGVVLSHRNMVDSTLPLRRNACIREGSIRCRSILDVVNAGFMASVLTYGPSLYTGGTHVFVQSEELEQIAPVAQIMKQEEVDFVLMTPSVMTTLLTDEGFSQSLSQVREITLCGESFSQQLADTLTDLTREGTIINNLYGTTEAAVGLACVDVRGREVTMGVPFAHTEVFAENELGERLPHGQVGQLCVKGPRVALGYHKLPELSAEKFFVDADGIRVYRTGDNGFVNQRGEIEFLGRDDRMVKLGGVRFELPEVEYHLLQLPYIREAAVKVCEVDGRDQLCAVYVGDESDTVRAGRRIRADLASVVPQAMIPSVYVHLRAMPVTERGKIDYSCLPIPTSVQVQDNTLPANETEQTICEAFAEVFGVASVGAEASFFELGGNSLRGITLLAALLKRGQSVSMKELLDHPTPRTLASLLHARQKTTEEDAQATDAAQEAIELPDELRELMASEAVEAILPASNVTSAYLFMGQAGVTDRANRIRVRLTLEGALEEAAFRRRVDALVRNHPSLRSDFVRDNQGRYWQVVRSYQDVPTYHKDLRRLSDAAHARLLSGFWQVMDESGQPFEAACFPVSAGRSVVLFEVEHTHADGMSLLIMANELANGASPNLPVDDFIDYRRRHVQAGQHIPLSVQQYLTPKRAPLKSPEAMLGQEVSRTEEVVELSRFQTDELVRRCGREGVTPFVLVQLSYGRALLSLLNEDEVWVLHTDGGRSSSREGESRIVGNLFCGVPLLIRATTTAAQLQEDILNIAAQAGISDSDLLRNPTWMGIYEGVVSEDFGEREGGLLSFEILHDANRGGNQMTMADGRLRITLCHADDPKRNPWFRRLAELLRAELLG
ncbi:MAG: non-ribosomal peptide synthetase [Coriobacteriales bacterium]|nr:non-ribosomal peptide synthetase [Coriobacteriales bacterium]